MRFKKWFKTICRESEFVYNGIGDSMLHESDLKKYKRCDKYYWYSKQEKVEYLPFITYNMDIYELVKEYFNLDDVFVGHKGDDVQVTLDAYEKYSALLNARLSYLDFRINIPCLIKKEDKNILYFVYTQCYPKINEAQKAYDTLYVMKKNKIQVDEIHMIHINANYERNGDLDVHECLMIGDEYYNDRNKKSGLIVDHIKECEHDLEGLIEEIHEIGDLSQVVKKRSSMCTSHYKCEFFKKCFPENQHDTSILNLVQSSKNMSVKNVELVICRW